MRILGIETSCDETSIALVSAQRGQLRVEKLVTASQILTHKKYGGVVPEVAAREHAETFFPVLKKIVSNPRRPNIDAVAVTSGPGLMTSLRVGVDAARTLAWMWQVPLIGVNHIEGHICANWLPTKKRVTTKIVFPAVVLIVSGGHTELLEMRGFGDYRLLGATRDDAAGECFDKTAQLLGLGYPGGPAIARLAADGNRTAFALPRPMIRSGDLDMSFAGLKTAMRLLVEQSPRRLPTADVCASFEQAVVDVLVAKTLLAVKQVKAKTVLLGGGVSANRHLRQSLSGAVKKNLPRVKYYEPDLVWTTDNAAMIAAAGYFRLRSGERTDPRTIAPDANWELGRNL